MRADVSYGLMVALLSTACGGPVVPLVQSGPEGIPKAYFEGDNWTYTRTYAIDGETIEPMGFEARALVVLQEDVLVIGLDVDDDQTSERRLAAGWPIRGHTSSTPCIEPVQSAIIEDCPAWWQRSHFVPDFEKPLVPPSSADPQFVGGVDLERRTPIEAIAESGRLVVAQPHEVHYETEPDAWFTIIVRHTLVRNSE